VTDRATAGGPAAQIVDYLYDAENRWIGETVDSDGDGDIDKQIRFVYDGNQIALQFDKDGTGDVTGDDLSHHYLRGPAVDQILADEQVTDSQTPGDVVWPLTDHLGTIRDLAAYDSQTDTTTVANHRVYDSFGNLVSETNAAVDCLFGFTGRPVSEATGLRNHWNRWTDPRTGDWMSKDPIGLTAGDGNTRRFCGNGPTNTIDPSGLENEGGWFWRNIAGPALQPWADFVNGLHNVAIVGGNCFAFIGNTGMATVNELAMMSTYGRPVFTKPIPYAEVRDWSRGIAAPEGELVHQFGVQTGELIGSAAVGRLLVQALRGPALPRAGMSAETMEALDTRIAEAKHLRDMARAQLRDPAKREQAQKSIEWLNGYLEELNRLRYPLNR
jgi:RHS repeat-associated protein